MYLLNVCESGEHTWASNNHKRCQTAWKPHRNSMYVKKSLNMRNLSTCRFWMFLTWKISTSRLIQKKPLKNLKEFRLLEQRCNNTHEVQEGIPPAVGFPQTAQLGDHLSPPAKKTRFPYIQRSQNWKIKGLSSMIVSCSMDILDIGLLIGKLLTLNVYFTLKAQIWTYAFILPGDGDIHKRFPRNHGKHEMGLGSAPHLWTRH